MCGEGLKRIFHWANYYMNKHIGMKLAYSWVMPGKHIKEISDKNFSVVQLRFQMIL